MEIKNKKKYNNQISKENNIDIKCIKTNRIKNKEKFSINKINNIEFYPVNKNDNYMINKEKIIKNIELNTERILMLNKDKNNINEINNSKTNINNLQINLIENEIIINDNNLKQDLENRIGLKKHFNQKAEGNNKTLKIKKKENIIKINKIPESRIHNNSVDFTNKKKLNEEEKLIKHNILMTNYRKYKDNYKIINTFIKTSFNDSKKDNNSLFIMNSPKIIPQKNPTNFFLNNNISKIKIDENKKSKETHLNKYNNFSQKDIKVKKETNIDKITPIKKNQSELSIFNKKIKQEENQLIKTSVSFDKIKQEIKKLVGNNVVENNDERNFKFICKTKIGKDDLIFYLELISMNFDTRIFRATLIKGETNIYKDLILKIREKLR